MNPEGPGKKFLPQIHGLRGFSALAVYFFHVYDMSSKQGFFPASGIWLVNIFKMGSHGVEVFFMISGFLITGSIIHHADARKFLIDRCIRIYPVFLVIHLGVFVLGPLMGYRLFNHVSFSKWLGMFVANLLFLPGIFDLPLAQLNAWSLSYEALFYIVAVAIYVLATRANRTLVWMLALCLIVALNKEYPGATFFASGVFVYFAAPRIKLHLPRYLSLICLPVMLFLLVLFQQDRDFRWHYAAFIVGLVMFWSVAEGNCWLSSILRTRFLQFFGTISYSFYLWHVVPTFPLKSIFSRLSGVIGPIPSVWLFGLSGFTCSVIISLWSYKLLEVGVAKRLKAALHERRTEVNTQLGLHTGNVYEMTGKL